MKKNFFVLSFLTFFLIFNSSYSEEKLVFVDINFIFNNSSAGKKVNNYIKDETKKINSELMKFQKKIDEEKKTLLTQKNVISSDEYEKKFKNLEKNLNEYRTIIQKKNNDLVDYKTKVRVEFSKRLKQLLEDYSKKNSISMILKKENILIGKTSLDATDDILNLFNQNVKKISIQ